MDNIEKALRSAVQVGDPHYCAQAADLLGVEHPDCFECGGDECDACAERVADAMAAHLMPEGVRWPRFADGERAAFRDEIDVDGSIERIQGFKFYESGPSFVSIVGVDREKWVRVEEGERVKRPEQPDTQERIDADARKGCSGYWECTGIACSECPALADGKKPYERDGAGCCASAMTIDLLRRQRELCAKDADGYCHRGGRR